MLVSVGLAQASGALAPLALIPFGLGFGWMVCETPHWKTLLGTLAAAGSIGGLSSGVVIALITPLRDGAGALPTSLAIAFGSPFLGALYAPFGAVLMGPVFVAAARARRANAHDAAWTVLAVAGVWSAIIAGALTILRADMLTGSLAACCALVGAVGQAGRVRVSRDVARIRAGLVPGFAALAGDHCSSMASEEPPPIAHLGARRSDAPLWIVARGVDAHYRASVEDTVIARVEDGPRPSLLRAGFAGPLPRPVELLLLGLWSGMLVLLAITAARA